MYKSVIRISLAFACVQTQLPQAIGSISSTSITQSTTPVSQLQQRNPSELPTPATLNDLINYALKNQPRMKQAELDQRITEREISSALSGWFPQISAAANYSKNIIIPTSTLGGQVINMGQPHASAMVLQADQQILNPGLLQASKAAKFLRENQDYQLEQTEINTVVEVSKAYYDLLTTQEQINIIRENITRIQKQLDDANARYESGIVDKTDFKRAQISLANARADQKRLEDILKYKYTYLNGLLGMKSAEPIELVFDLAAMENDLALDTNQQVVVENRVEFQQLSTLRKIQSLNTQYRKWSFLPTISATYNYALDFRSDKFNDLYKTDYPRSVFGLQLNLPIFQGMKRTQEVRRSELLEERMDWDIVQLENNLRTEYQLALATYTSNLNALETAKENVNLSKEVYEVIQLQYQEGIKTYLDLMMAEAELKTSQINYLNALFAVQAGKLDAEKALGKIQTR